MSIDLYASAAQMEREALPTIGVCIDIHAGRSIEDIEDWTAAFFRHPERIQITRYSVEGA